MVRLEFLADATPQELIKTITDEVQHMAPYPSENGTFVFESVQETILPLMQELALQVKGRLQGTASLIPQRSVSAHFTFTPVGRGQTTEITVISGDELLRPYLVEICRHIAEKWPMAKATLRRDGDPKPEPSLSELQLLTDFENFQIELENFTRAYSTDDVKYVNLAVRRDRFLHRGSFIDRKEQLIDPNRVRSWEVRLNLLGVRNPWASKVELLIDVEISRLGGRFPVLLKITSMSPYAHLESVKFANDFVLHCKKTWEWATTRPTGESVEIGSKHSASEGSQVNELGAVTPEIHKTQPGQAKPNAEMPNSESDGLPPPPASQAEPKSLPWEKIPDLAWDRQALRLWWEGHTHKEIGQKLHLAEKTVLNRLSALRKTYGEEIVVTERKRRRRPSQPNE